MVVVFALLFTVVQAAVLVLVDRVGLSIARERNSQELQVGERVFRRLLDQNRQRLLQAAEVLSKDFAFRQAIATGDAPTISSVLYNHGTRIQAGVMMLVSPDDTLTADSLHPAQQHGPFPNPALIRVAQQQGRASAIMRIDSNLYQVVVVPVLAPDPIAWVAMGFAVDQSFARRLACAYLSARLLPRTESRGRLAGTGEHATRGGARAIAVEIALRNATAESSVTAERIRHCGRCAGRRKAALQSRSHCNALSPTDLNRLSA